MRRIIWNFLETPQVFILLLLGGFLLVAVIGKFVLGPAFDTLLQKLGELQIVIVQQLKLIQPA